MTNLKSYTKEEISSHCRDAIFHDAAEVYISDIPGPIKQNFSFAKELQQLEERIWKPIALKYSLSKSIPAIVMDKDSQCLINELHTLHVEGDYAINEKFGRDTSREDLHAVIVRYMDYDYSKTTIYGSMFKNALALYYEMKDPSDITADELCPLKREDAKLLFLDIVATLDSFHYRL